MPGFHPITLTFSENSNYWRERSLEGIRQNITGWCQQTFCFQKFVDNAEQCFAFTPHANFPAHNLNFHWVKVMGSNSGYLLKSFLLYLESRDSIWNGAGGHILEFVVLIKGINFLSWDYGFMDHKCTVWCLFTYREIFFIYSFSN